MVSGSPSITPLNDTADDDDVDDFLGVGNNFLATSQAFNLIGGDAIAGVPVPKLS
jgi:hypothetical protein